VKIRTEKLNLCGYLSALSGLIFNLVHLIALKSSPFPLILPVHQPTYPNSESFA